MLVARARSARAAAWAVTTGAGEPVATLTLSPDRDGASLEHDGRSFRIARERVVSGAWQLRDGDTLLFEAKRTPLIENRLLTIVKGAVLEIAPQGRGLRNFGVVGPDWADLGTIRRRGLLGLTLHADLSDLIPRPAQLFLLFQAIAIARRLPLE